MHAATRQRDHSLGESPDAGFFSCAEVGESSASNRVKAAQMFNPPAWHAKNPASGLGMDICMSIGLKEVRLM